MATLSPAKRERLIEQLREMLNDADAYFPFAEFRREAEHILRDYSAEERFAIVLHNLWREHLDEAPKNWRDTLRDRYDKFVAAYSWDTSERVLSDNSYDLHLPDL